MNLLYVYTLEQYAMVRDARKVLLDYCATLSTNDFVHQNTNFGRGGSIRNLLVHNANTYIHWIANVSLQKKMPFLEYEQYTSPKEIVFLYDIIDSLMDQFLLLFESDPVVIEFEKNNVTIKTIPFKIFTHVITHEFHHKGQILSLSRHMGYVPVDTDILR